MAAERKATAPVAAKLFFFFFVVVVVPCGLSGWFAWVDRSRLDVRGSLGAFYMQTLNSGGSCQGAACVGGVDSLGFLMLILLSVLCLFGLDGL